MPPIPNDADFCVEIEFKKGSENPSRVFRAMSEIIETFQIIDKELVQSVDVKIEPVLMLEDIETGSLRAWLRAILIAVDDDALKNIDWRPAVGKYLVKAKYILIDFVGHNTTVSDRHQLSELGTRLLAASQETDVRKIPTYALLPQKEIARSLQLLGGAAALLGEGDSAKYIAGEDEASFNLNFAFSPDAIEDLLTRETIENEQTMILKVKKPDYLGDSMWDFRFESRTIQAKVSDVAWLQEFQARQVEVRPGDAIRANVRLSVRYGYDGEVVATHYYLLKVLQVIPMQASAQNTLF